MAILTDSFSSFNIATQGKISSSRAVRSVPDIRSTSKISSSRALRSVPDLRSTSKITPFNALRSVPDLRSTSKITHSGKLKNAIDDRFTSYCLSRFNPTNNPSDFTLEVTGQNVDSNTNRYTIDALYTELTSNEGYLWNKLSHIIPTSITLYFPKQPSIRFYSGELIRIRNINSSYSEIVTVINSTFDSVTYFSSNLIPEISGTFIDSGSTLYERLYFNANNASDSFKKYFYSLLAPGLYSKKFNVILNNIPENSKVEKIKSITPYKGTNDVPNVEQVILLKTSAVFELKDDRKVHNFKIPFAEAQLLHNTAVTLLSKKLLKIKDIPLYFIPEKVLNTKFYNNKILEIENINFINKGFKVTQVYEKNSRGLVSYAFTYKSVDFSFANTVTTLTKSISTLKSTSETSQSNFLQRKLFTLNSISDRLSVNKIILPLKAVLSTYETPYRVDALYLQSLVSTNVAPTNARENLYYATLAPGLRNKTTIIRSSNYASYDTNRSSNRIENFYAQSLVSTNVASTNARENLYYATLAPGSRNKTTYILSSNYASYDTNRSSNEIENFYTQSLVSTNVAPVSPREVLYYVNLAGGLRNGSTYIRSSYDFQNVNFNSNRIENFYAQSLVSTNVAPTNARENLYYAKLTPGIRSNILYPITADYTHVGFNINVEKVSSFVQIKSVEFNVSLIVPSYYNNGITEFYNISLGSLITAPNSIKNLYTSFSTPGKRSTKSFGYGLNLVSSPSEIFNSYNLLNKITLKSVPYFSNLYHLSRFSPDKIYDVRLEITGQNLDSSIKTENVETLYIENNSDEGYIWTGNISSNSFIKTLYFSTQSSLIFGVGEVIRIRNVNSGYTTDVTVTNCTFNSVSYTSSNLLPEISGTFVESGPSLIPQSTVRTSTAPITARENLYYAILAGGFRGKINYDFLRKYEELLYKYPVGKLDSSPITKLKYIIISSIDNNNINYGKINTLKIGDFKVGSNKMQDMAATKKAPIQFWS